MSYMDNRVNKELLKGEDAQRLVKSEIIDRSTYPHLKERTQEHIEKSARKDWDKYYEKEKGKLSRELAVVKTKRHIRETVHNIGSGFRKSLQATAVYRRGKRIGSSYNIHNQLERLEHPIGYEDKPRYYKKVYNQEKKNFFFK